MIIVAATKTLACAEMASAGTTAYHHSLVRHHTSATMMTQTPMMISVLPMRDQTMVMEFHRSVRPSARAVLMASSVFRSSRGPLMSRPTPTMTPKSTTAGASRRRAMSRSADPTGGRDLSIS